MLSDIISQSYLYFYTLLTVAAVVVAIANEYEDEITDFVEKYIFEVA